MPPTVIPPASVSPLVAVLLAVKVLGTGAVLALATIAPKVAHEFGVDPSLVGYQVSVIGGAMLVWLLLAGNVSRRWGACRAMQVGLALMSAGCLLALVPSLVALLIASILLGLGYSQLTPSTSHVLVRMSPSTHRNLVFSLIQAGVPLGGVLVAAVAPPVAVAFGWRWVFVALALLLAALVLFLQRWREWSDDGRDPAVRLVDRPLASLALVWRQPALRLMSIGGAFLLSVQDCLAAFTVVLFVTDGGYSLIAAGFVLTVSQAGGMVGRLLWGWVADRLRNAFAALTVLTVVLAAACVLVVAVDGSWPLAAAYGLFFILGLTAAGWNGAYLAEIARSSPAGAVVQATGGSLFFVNSGKLLGPPLFALAYPLVGSYTSTFGLLIVPTLAALGCMVAARRADAGGGMSTPAAATSRV